MAFLDLCNKIRQELKLTMQPSASYSLTLRVKLSSKAGTLGELTTAIGRAGGDIGAIDIVSAATNSIVRDNPFYKEMPS
ncbi:MAG TPA: hypothetical protein VI750_04015 [Pyrinomonadaceae bacterium]|nr:hypothetical protein [Pyrinomonadaceae bacterium]